MRPSRYHDKILTSPILNGPCTGNDSYSKLQGTMALSYTEDILVQRTSLSFCDVPL